MASHKDAVNLFKDIVPTDAMDEFDGVQLNVRSIVRFEPYMASDTIGAQIEQMMMEFGSGPITDLDRFMMPDLDNCDIDGNEIVLDEIGDRRSIPTSERHCVMSGTMYYNEFGEEC